MGCQLSVLADNSEFAASLNFLDINKVNDKLRRLPDMDSMIEDNDAAKPYKLMYKCNSDFKDLNYPEFFIEDINSKRGNFSVKDVDTLYEYNANKKPYIPYDAILYSLKDQDTEYIFIYKLGIRALLSNHRVYFGKLIVLNTSKVNSEKVHETTIFGATDKLLSMPTDIKDCIAVLKIKENDDKHELGVFKPLEYNSLFKDYKKRKEIARNNIDKFNDGSFKIADGMSVKISGDKDTIEEMIDKNNDILEGLESYRNTKNRKINQTPSKELEEGLKELSDHAKGTEYAKEHLNSDSFYYKDEVPRVETIEKTGEKTLIVTPRSLPIFVALIQNVAIKRILNGIYEIPYYKRQFVKNMKSGNWKVGRDILEGHYIVSSLKGDGTVKVQRKQNILKEAKIKESLKREECEADFELKEGDILIIEPDEVQILNYIN